MLPYTNIGEIPESIRLILPEEGQQIYMDAYNNTHDQYEHPSEDGIDGKTDEREEISQIAAWDAVREKYKKGPDGKWHEK